jgi:hypothetical protein
MTGPEWETTVQTPPMTETAASAYHLSDTLVWDSVSAQIKNGMVIVGPVSFEIFVDLDK